MSLPKPFGQVSVPLQHSDGHRRQGQPPAMVVRAIHSVDDEALARRLRAETEGSLTTLQRRRDIFGRCQEFGNNLACELSL